MTLNEIEKTTKSFSDARRSLAEKVQTLEDEMTALKRRHLPGIRKAVETAAERQAILKAAIEESASLFMKPRTVTFWGVKVGYIKGKGELQFDSAEQVIKLIKKHFPEQADVLIKTKEEPVKKALSQLSVHDLKRIGVTVIETGDEIVIVRAPTARSTSSSARC